MSEAVFTGGCLCGQVRYEARGEPVNVRACHCRLCQQVTGQAFYARALFPNAAVSVTGEYRRHPSSAALDRGFCPTCGATLFAIRHDPAMFAVSLASLDEPHVLAPTDHIWTSRKLPWVCIEDGVAQHPEAFPA